MSYRHGQRDLPAYRESRIEPNLRAMPFSKPLWLILAPVIFLLLWSGGFSVAKLGLKHVEPMSFLSLRYASVLVILLPLYFILRPPLPKRGMEWVHLLIVGFLIQAVYFGLSYIAFAAGVSAGGVAIIVCLQPILVGLIAPHVLVINAEVSIAMVACTAVILIVLYSEPSSPVRQGRPRWAWGGLLLVLAALTSTQVVQFQRTLAGVHEVHRNFFGVLQVKLKPAAVATSGLVCQLIHGRTMHGLQFVDADKRQCPTSYYGEQSAIGGGGAWADEISYMISAMMDILGPITDVSAMMAQAFSCVVSQRSALRDVISQRTALACNGVAASPSSFASASRMIMTWFSVTWSWLESSRMEFRMWAASRGGAAWAAVVPGSFFIHSSAWRASENTR